MVTRRIHLVLAVGLGAGACGPTFSRTPIVIPPEAVREWAYLPDGQTAPGRYVVRMTDGKREWEVEFPDAASGSEVRVPLRGGPAKFSPDRTGSTSADRELDDERAARRGAQHEMEPGFHESGAGVGTAAVPADKGKAAGAKRQKSSYLVGVAQIRELYAARNYEIALVQLVDLEKDYPNDEKLLAMKGSIYRRLGKTKLAREAWERVLALNPDNTVVAGAMRELAEEEERGAAKREQGDAAGAEGAPEGAREGPPEAPAKPAEAPARPAPGR